MAAGGGGGERGGGGAAAADAALRRGLCARASPFVWLTARFTAASSPRVSGISGIDAAYHLKQAKKHFVVLERRASFGGTWDLVSRLLRADEFMAGTAAAARPAALRWRKAGATHCRVLAAWECTHSLPLLPC